MSAKIGRPTDCKKDCDVKVRIDNVTNEKSKAFYLSHGVKNISYAIEHKDYKFTGDEILMHTRYCILRELGCCRKNKQSEKMPQRLFLVNDRVKLLVETDCVNCEMKIKKYWI